MRVEVEGFEEREVRNTKKKRRRRVEEKSKKRNFGERSLVGLSLFHAFAMEKKCLRFQSFVFSQRKHKKNSILDWILLEVRELLRSVFL